MPSAVDTPGDTPSDTPGDSPGVHLVRARDQGAAIEALAEAWTERGGARVDVATLLDDLDRRARRAALPMPLPGVRRAWTWDAADRRDPRWWPQGVTTSADADASGEVEGRSVVVVSWYAKALPGDPKGGHGVRVSFFDPDRRRYRHVLVVVPGSEDGGPVTTPLRVHAGGLVWVGSNLHVAATARGFWTCSLTDLLRVPDDLVDDHFGYRYVLPVRVAHQAGSDDGVEPLRYSFLSLDRSREPARLLVGEYARGRQTRRLARFDLDPATGLPALEEDGTARPELLEGVAQMQGAVVVGDTWVVTASRGPWSPGSVYSGRPGALVERRWSTPMGPEDITYWPRRDELWSVTEHPRRRWIFAMRRSRFC